MREVTLCYLVEPERILLAMKKRGFGSGKVNGYGGKLTPGETLEEAALREMQEEIGIHANESDLEKVADISFHFDEKPDWNQRMHVYFVRIWRGEPVESEEMAPEWHALSALPYERMWASDTYWLPRVLAGERVEGDIHFEGEGNTVAKSELRTL